MFDIAITGDFSSARVTVFYFYFFINLLQIEEDDFHNNVGPIINQPPQFTDTLTSFQMVQKQSVSYIYKAQDADPFRFSGFRCLPSY